MIYTINILIFNFIKNHSLTKYGIMMLMYEYDMDRFMDNVLITTLLPLMAKVVGVLFDNVFPIIVDWFKSLKYFFGLSQNSVIIKPDGNIHQVNEIMIP